MMKALPKILIVDDSELFRSILREILSADYILEEASDGHDVLALIKNFEPDLVLLDVIMPQISGIEVCRRIKAEPANDDIQIIMLTGQVDEDDVKEGLDAGAIDYIKKPFNEAELFARIRSALRLHSTIQQLKESNIEKQSLIESLQEALKKVKTLSGLLPICSCCKKIRDDGGYWKQVEEYVQKYSEAEFSHSICPECIKDLHPELYLEMFEEEEQSE